MTLKEIQANTNQEQVHLLEQYKLYVEMADRISQRRGSTNKFYSVIIVGLLSVLITVLKDKIFAEANVFIILAVAYLGIALCNIWKTNILSCKQLNSAKFKVIHEMEKYLPFSCYDVEWDYLERGKNEEKYHKLTVVEMKVPDILSYPYWALLGYSGITLIFQVISLIISFLASFFITSNI